MYKFTCTCVNSAKLREIKLAWDIMHKIGLPVQPLGYVMSTKVIFRRIEVFVLAEVNLGLMFERKAKISCNGDTKCH